MDKRYGDTTSGHDGEEIYWDSPGTTYKSASLAGQDISEADLKRINEYTLEPVTAEQVFAFKAVLCDNAIDRDFERFSLKALQDLQKRFLGKTVIQDHNWKSGNQVARIYATELQQSDKVLDCGEPYTQLVARCYMIRTPGNADLIAEIKGGIKREGSVGVSVASATCSICGTDNRKSYCAHYPGRAYDTAAGKRTCTYTFDGASDAYEFSLVAVPAQRAAGVIKNYLPWHLAREQLGTALLLQAKLYETEIAAMRCINEEETNE
nr:MAG TPA: prohead serine protease [Caudoviricetes sp.]